MSEMPFTTEEDSAGRILKKLRGERGLTVQDVAAQLHLEPRIIDALEGDDQHKLPAALYVRGYIRGYAKILKVDADPLVALFNDSGSNEPPEIIPEVKRATQRSSSDKPVKAFTYFVTLTLVVMVVAWWQSNNTLGSRAPAMVESAAEDVPPPPQLDYTFPVIQHSESPFYRAPSDEDPLAMDTVLATDESGQPREGPQGVVTEGEGPDTIVLKLSADSWIEVTDARDEKVFVNLGRSGELLELHGTAPFFVIIGFAQGVSVEYNGRPFDPAPYSRAGVARFTLDN